MSKIAVVIDIDVVPEKFEEYHRRMCTHAQTSLAEDEGCERFDIMAPGKNEKNRLLVYEIWASRDALAAHSDSGHTAQHREGTQGLTTGRKLTICDLSEGGRA